MAIQCSGGAKRSWKVENVHGLYRPACPKDFYPLPRIDLLVDSTGGCALFSMMDAYQGYHQIFMAEEDRDKTFFIVENGIYCYNVMPFGLNNAGATYQRLANKMFKELIEKIMEVYVDDMLVKSKEEEEHLNHLQVAFEVMRKYGMKLNPTKCTFGVRGGKFLGYMVSEKGIEANPEKIKAIMQMSSSKTIKEVQKLTGKVASLARFISRSAYRNLPFFKILRKVKDFQWMKECEKALRDLKQYLATPPLLVNPKVGEPEQQRRESWMLHVDGSLTSSAGGARILLQGPRGVKIEITTKLDFPTTNNEAKYEALTMGLEMALEAGVK
ncbi:UNVERIFIED_CONTAM: Transposon Tf2-12 polyprotein [Sesamum radiatum]|uniref:Transposon Tf2-12 polyprotein n=1 Tax=Sesamum radiatum TaxID=300843 RepID=A0AAW2S5W7_SESRA